MGRGGKGTRGVCGREEPFDCGLKKSSYGGGRGSTDYNPKINDLGKEIGESPPQMEERLSRKKSPLRPDAVLYCFDGRGNGTAELPCIFHCQQKEKHVKEERCSPVMLLPMIDTKRGMVKEISLPSVSRRQEKRNPVSQKKKCVLPSGRSGGKKEEGGGHILNVTPQ